MIDDSIVNWESSVLILLVWRLDQLFWFCQSYLPFPTLSQLPRVLIFYFGNWILRSIYLFVELLFSNMLSLLWCPISKLPTTHYLKTFHWEENSILYVVFDNKECFGISVGNPWSRVVRLRCEGFEDAPFDIEVKWGFWLDLIDCVTFYHAYQPYL